MTHDSPNRSPLPISSRDDQHLQRADLAAIFHEVCTERLVLRRLRMGDGPALFAIHGDPATNRFHPAGPDSDLATSEETLRRWRQHWDTFGFGSWAVMLPQTTKILGFGGVSHLVWRQREVLNLYSRFTPSA